MKRLFNFLVNLNFYTSMYWFSWFVFPSSIGYFYLMPSWPHTQGFHEGYAGVSVLRDHTAEALHFHILMTKRLGILHLVHFGQASFLEEYPPHFEIYVLHLL